MLATLQSIFSGFGIKDAIDIAIVAVLIYIILEFIRETRAEQLVKGIVVLGVITLLSGVFEFYTLSWIMRGAMTLGAVALVVIFQPELRRGLEYIGRNRLLGLKFGDLDKQQAKHLISEFTRAIDYFSATKTGALIVIERQTRLTDIVETGTKIDAEISAEMLGNIFYKGAPLHDGALIVRDNRLYAAGCVLPLTENKRLDKDMGTRHRAGIGITEKSDALVLIVSEETGGISMALDGKIERFLSIKTVEKALMNIYLEAETPVGARRLMEIFRPAENTEDEDTENDDAAK